MVAASQGYDIPAFAKLNDFKTWAEEGPPKGTLYHYPPKPGQILSVSGLSLRRPRSPSRSTRRRSSTKMVAKCTQGGESIDKAHRLGRLGARRLHARLSLAETGAR